MLVIVFQIAEVNINGTSVCYTQQECLQIKHLMCVHPFVPVSQTNKAQTTNHLTSYRKEASFTKKAFPVLQLSAPLVCLPVPSKSICKLCLQSRHRIKNRNQTSVSGVFHYPDFGSFQFHFKELKNDDI